MQTSQLRDTLLDGQCDTDSPRRSLHGFVEHGGIQVHLEHFNSLELSKITVATSKCA